MLAAKNSPIPDKYLAVAAGYLVCDCKGRCNRKIADNTSHFYNLEKNGWLVLGVESDNKRAKNLWINLDEFQIQNQEFASFRFPMETRQLPTKFK